MDFHFGVRPLRASQNFNSSWVAGLTDIPCCMERTSILEPGRAVQWPPRGPRETWLPWSAAVTQRGSHTRWRGVVAGSWDELQTGGEAAQTKSLVRDRQNIGSSLESHTSSYAFSGKTWLEIKTSNQQASMRTALSLFYSIQIQIFLLVRPPLWLSVCLSKHRKCLRF